MSACQNDFVTVVSGLPRSGTSLMMQMLGAGGMPLLVDQERPPDEDNPGGYFEFSPVKSLPRDHSWLAAAQGRAVKVVYRLLLHLPTNREYRVILMRRDLREVLASQRVILERRGVTDLARVDEAVLAGIFSKQLEEVESWARSSPSVRLLCVEHGRLMRDPILLSESVNDFLSGGLDVSAMARCPELDLFRQRHAESDSL